MSARLVTTVVCAALSAAPCSAQGPLILEWGGGAGAEADALYFAGRPEAAWELLREHLVEAPSDYDALWRAVRSAVVLGVAEEGWRRQNPWFDGGMELADRAVAARPDGIEGRYWRGAVYGRRALNAAPEYGAGLAQRAYEDAYAILASEPDHGGAHHILGKIFFEIMSMSRIQRWLGRTFVRTDALRESSWEKAEHHLEAAAVAWPDWVLFQHDLAELYRKRGREEEARAAYERVTHMAVVHPSDPALQENAHRMLQELGS